MFAIDTTGITVLAFLCVFIHECGHIFSLLLFKVPIEKISMRLFGIDIEIKKDYAISYKKEAVVALSGCFANFLSVAVALILAKLNISKNICEIIAIESLIIGIINILPISSLDGARALESFLLQKFSLEQAQKAVNATSAVFIVPLMCCGTYVFYISKFNISLVVVAIYLLASLFKKKGVITAYKHDKSGSR